MNTNVITSQAHTAPAAEAKAGLSNGQVGEAIKTAAKREEPEWGALLNEALTEPGKVSTAYSLFHSYSLGNSLWLLGQLYGRGIEPGPVATFRQWQEMGRQVRKGEKAFAMCMPMMAAGKRSPRPHKKRLPLASVSFHNMLR